MVGREGFEPPKVEPVDLQSTPFDRSGIDPKFCDLNGATSRVWTDDLRFTRPSLYQLSYGGTRGIVQKDNKLQPCFLIYLVFKVRVLSKLL